MKPIPQEPFDPAFGRFDDDRSEIRNAVQRRAEAILIWALWLVTMMALRPVFDWVQGMGERLPLVGAAIQTGVRAALES